ncbi:MAG: hypothetical protein ABIY51_05680, partial [Ferruginibacter sp.]
MNYPFYSKKTMSFFVITALLIIGCNDDKDKAVTATSTMSDTAVAMAPAPPAAGLTSGSLDTLWITAADFKALDKNKADFIFYFGTNDTVTLHGWKDKGGLDPYNPTPDVILKKGHKDATLTYG